MWSGNEESLNGNQTMVFQAGMIEVGRKVVLDRTFPTLRMIEIEEDAVCLRYQLLGCQECQGRE